jgi:hypothetical protein
MKFFRKFLLFAVIVAILSIAWFQWWHLSKSVIPLDDHHQEGGLSYTLSTPLPVRITEGGGTSHNGHMYIVGGIDAYGKTNNKFWQYDAATAKWTQLPDVPAYINHPGVVAAHNKVYVVGGFDPIGIRLRWLMFADWKPLNSVYIYNITRGEWTRGKDMPFHRGAGGVAVNDTAIWYVGGINEEKKISNKFAYYNLKDDAWHMLPDMPTARDHMRMEFANNRLFAISGREDDLRKNLSAVEVYDPATQQWSSVKPIPVARGGFSTAVMGKYIYTFGGESFFDCFDAVERLDTETGEWEQLPPLPEGRHGIISGVINGKIHLVSGGRHPRISTSNIHRVLEINNSSEQLNAAK